MTRRRRAPLFRDTEPDVYLVDTSAWINIDGRKDAASIWKLIYALIAARRLVLCGPVIGEIRDNPLYALRLKWCENDAKSGDRDSDDPEYLHHVGNITYEHAGMSRAMSWKTRADPYVVALAELEGYVVVAEETTAKRPNTKIPGVCKQRKIRCLSLDEFVSEAEASLDEGKQNEARSK